MPDFAKAPVSPDAEFKNAGSAPRVSLSKAAWDELLASRTVWWPWVLAFGVMLAVIALLTPATHRIPPEVSRQHPEMAFKELKTLMPYMIARMAVSFMAIYAFTVAYLQYTVKANPPSASLGGFFFWLGRLAAKIFRPILWLLLPIIGIVFYVRSLVRRTTVTPMAVLRQKDIMRRSWDLTEGHVWRIIGHSLLLDLRVFFYALGAFVIIVIPVALVAYLLHVRVWLAISVAGKLFQGGLDALLIMATSIYYCTVLRVLLKEKKEAVSEAEASLSSPSA
ncbi:MAG: hypothetical protein KGI97_04680 [Alphaproteobacteria bacterium]|nr:hypothetical protein [Alphaproteobacteria bacterium]